MRILVDTSVWSLLLYRKKNTNHPASLFLQQKIREKAAICIAGIIFQEILQGIRLEAHFNNVKKYLLDFDFLETTQIVHERATEVYQQCRKKGISIHTIDALIASLAMEYNAALLTTDKDFERVADISELQLLKIL